MKCVKDKSKSFCDTSTSHAVYTWLVFKSPVAWTGKKTGTGLDQTDLDRIAGCSCIHFGMERLPVAEPVGERVCLVNTFKMNQKS